MFSLTYDTSLIDYLYEKHIKFRSLGETISWIAVSTSVPLLEVCAYLKEKHPSSELNNIEENLRVFYNS